MMIRMFFISLALTGCSVAAPAPAAPPTFDPLAFFTGPSRGEGTLKVMTKPGVPIRVESNGRPDGKGGIILDQTVRQAGKPERVRRWNLRPISATRLTGTLSDATSPVSGELSGNRLHLAYRMKGGLAAEQFLYLQPDERTLLNRMTVRKFGLVVARVDERIFKSE